MESAGFAARNSKVVGDCVVSALDGGAPRWLQRAALPLVEPEHASQETQAMRDAFRPKRDVMVKRLKEMDVIFPRDTEPPTVAFLSPKDGSQIVDGLNQQNVLPGNRRL